MDKQPKGTILSGYRVLDLADGKDIFCSRLLADMGADVVRIERPGSDSARSFLSWEANAGKRGITLNLEAEHGRDIFKRLVETADVLVESYQPGYLEASGLGFPQLSEINPRLIMASITLFGQSGPYRDYKSCDMVASALGGQMYICGEPESTPLKPFGAQTYRSACLFAAVGILLALWNRRATGRGGQHIDISVQDCVAAALDHTMVRYFYEGIVSERQGSLHWNNAFRIFPCRDRYILLSLFQHWETLVEWLDSEGMAEDLTDKKWLDMEERRRHLKHVIEVLERWTLSHTVTELVEQGQLMRFPWAEVTSISGLLDSPQLRERDFWVEAEHPRSGEHNREVYNGELGLSEEEIERLIREGVI
ncbi:CaiB/BaiF CoA transferase family protein [Chloroflexota bacterium]